MADVSFQGTRQEIVDIAFQVGAMLAGDEPDEHGVAKSFLLSLGYGALSDIKDAYVEKADGGTDEMGIQWKRLSREYLAYGRRFGRGEQARLKRAEGLGRAHSRAPGGKKGLLTAGQLKQWRKLFRDYASRFLLSGATKAEAHAHAAAVAWVIMKKRGARTKLEVFGDRKVQILRDTGRLLTSLSPGLLSGTGDGITYQPPSPDQIFETEPGVVIVGTNVEYAGPHQETRPFLPDERNPVPVVWWDRWTAIAIASLIVAVEHLYRARGRI